MPTVVVCGENPNDANGPAIRLLEGRGFDVRVVDDVLFGQGNRSDEEEIECLKGANATVAWGERYPAGVIEALPDLRVIARMGVGFDKVDLKSASERGVVVTVTPNANHEAVAEHALAFIMSLAKLIVTGNKRMREGEWPSGPGKPLRGTTLGIVGLGRIGRSLAVRAVAMRMRVIATELYPDREFVAEHGIELVDLDTLLGSSDYVSLHCPLNDETRGFINKTTLESMNPNGVLINTARGGLVVEDDLHDALKSGRSPGRGWTCSRRSRPTRTTPCTSWTTSSCRRTWRGTTSFRWWRWPWKPRRTSSTSTTASGRAARSSTGTLRVAGAGDGVDAGLVGVDGHGV